MGGVSPLFRVASHYFSEFFNFGLVEYKDVEKLRSTFQSYPKPSESDLPQAVTLIGQEPSDEEFASVRISAFSVGLIWDPRAKTDPDGTSTGNLGLDDELIF